MTTEEPKKDVNDNGSDSSVMKDLKKDFSDQVGNELRKASKKAPLGVKLLVILVVLGILGGVGYLAYDKLFVNKGHKLDIVSVSTLTDVIEISNLSTLEFTYNAVVSVPTDDEKPTIKYHVKYEGTVTAGIDIEDVDISIDDKNILITIPEATIQNVDINTGTLEYIFEKEKYNTMDVPAEANKICKADLERRAKEEDDLLNIAKENAASAISALIEPWISEVSSEYVVEVR